MGHRFQGIKTPLREIAPDSRILFMRASAVGDVLNMLPTVNAVRRKYPKAHIGFLVDDRSQDFVRNHESIDVVHFFPKKRFWKLFTSPLSWLQLSDEIRDLKLELRQQDYDWSVDMMHSFKGGCLGYLAGAKNRLGLDRPYTREFNEKMTHFQVSPPNSAVHFCEHFLSFATYLNADISNIEYKIPKSIDSEKVVDEFLRANSVDNYYLIHPGTSDFGRLKRWPAERFAELARKIQQELKKKVVVAWGPTEKPLAEKIVDLSSGAAILALKTRSLLDLTELIRKAQLFIGCDSGPMHIAGAMRVPCVAIFGPKDPNVYGPYRHPNCEIVQPPGGIGETSAISVENVFGSVSKLSSVFEKS